MNEWTWANIGKPMWLVLKRRGLNKDLRNLFMKRYSQLMNECLLARHTQLLDEALPTWSWPFITARTIDVMLCDRHFSIPYWIIEAIKVCKLPPTMYRTHHKWTDPERTWKSNQKYAERRLEREEATEK